MCADTEHAPITRYGREDDLGRTELGDVGVMSKGDIRVEAFAVVEEANTAIGHALAMAGFEHDVAEVLAGLQNDLFDVAADLMAPMGEDLDPPPVRIGDDHVQWVDRAAHHYAEPLEPVDGFVIPGGTAAASLLYMARVVIRRAERVVVKALEEHPGELDPAIARYLNSVSSLLFVLARHHNVEHGDLMWQPRVTITPPEEGQAQAAS